MSEYKEFQGKTLDEAIKGACSFYDTTREKLEIEIVSDAKGGIFGLVGVRKACIRARRADLDFDNLFDVFAAEAEAEGRVFEKKTPPVPTAQPSEQATQAQPRRDYPREKTERKAPPKSVQGQNNTGRPARKEAKEGVTPQVIQEGKRKEQPGRRSQPKNAAAPIQSPHQDDSLSSSVDFEGGDDLPRIPFEDLDKDRLSTVAENVVKHLVSPLLDDAAYTVTCTSDRVLISIATEDDPGLLIGRDGQTLTSVQYLATRLVSNQMRALVRVQVDVADYRERQDERLRELALALAEKAKNSGKSQLTRPLASYHRRVIHVTLQEDAMIQTHSKGEGELKRVVVALRRKPQKNNT